MDVTAATLARAAALSLALASAASAQSRLASTNPVDEGLFGGAVAALGDINGDGFSDLVVGAPGETYANMERAGRVYVYSGANGALIRIIHSPFPRLSGLFGAAVAGVDDVDGDAVPDIAIGAPQESAHDTFVSGRAYIFSGRTGLLLRQLVSPGRQTGGRFGTSIAGVPDTDGDGRGDVIVGAPGENPGASPPACGRAYLYSGRTGANTRRFSPPIPQANGSFGYSVAGIPDTNNDGRGDIIIGAPREGFPVNSGRAHIYSGATGLRRVTVQSPGLEANGFFGTSVSGMPDANGDGRGDVVVGAPNESPGASPDNCGRAYIYSGFNGTFWKKLLPPVNILNGNFGVSVAGVPDTNGDGRGDVIVGAWQEGAVDRSGQAHVYTGATGQRMFTLVSPNPDIDGRFGVTVAGLSNAGATFRGDFAIGASAETPPPSSTSSGRAFIFRR